MQCWKTKPPAQQWGAQNCQSGKITHHFSCIILQWYFDITIIITAKYVPAHNWHYLFVIFKKEAKDTNFLFCKEQSWNWSWHLFIQSNILVQSWGSHILVKSRTACCCCFSEADCPCISIPSVSNIPRITSAPNCGLNEASSSMTCTYPAFRPNSTWKYGKFLGIQARNPLPVVSMSFFELCWLHSLSASSIACIHVQVGLHISHPR